MARTEGSEGQLLDIDTGMLRKGRVLLQRSKDAYFCIGFGSRPAGICGFAFEDAGSADPFIAQCQRVAAGIENDELAKAQRSSAGISRTKIWHKPLHRLAVAEALAKSGFNPEELRDWHGRWALEGGGDFLVPLNAGVESASADHPSEGSAPLRLPPGKRIDELGDLLEWIANSKPEDEPAIRGEIKRLYYDVGDIWGGNALNAAVSNAMESSQPIDRKAILDTYEPYTREDPAEVGQAMRDMVSGILLFPGSALLPREVPPAPAPAPAEAEAEAEAAAPSAARSIKPWKLGWAARGQYFDDMFPGRTLPRSFPGIDDFIPTTGEIISNKTIDLNAATYQSAARLSARINKYVDGVAEFDGEDWGGFAVKSEDIRSRTLRLGIPKDGTTSDQLRVIEGVRARARSLGIELRVVPF